MALDPRMSIGTNIINLPTRDEFLRSVVDLRGASRARIFVLRLGRKGQINEDSVIANADILHIQGVSAPQEERVQIVPNHSDDGKAYFFGRTHRMYSFTGFIADSDLTEGQGGLSSDKAFGGKLYSQWKKIYEEYLRIGVAVNKGYITKIIWRTTKMFGYLMGHVSSQDSMSPFMVNVNFSFLAIKDEEMNSLPFVRVGKTLFRGAISREGAERVTGIDSVIGSNFQTTALPPKKPRSRIQEYVKDHQGGGWITKEEASL